MSTIDQQFIEYIVKQLVNNADAVQVARTIDEKGVLLELTVDAEDIGRVIGKHGSTAQSLRNLLRALGTKNDARYNLKIIDVDRPESERHSTNTGKSDHKSNENREPVDNSTPDTVENDNDLAKKTRQELADLDDLDI